MRLVMRARGEERRGSNASGASAQWACRDLGYQLQHTDSMVVAEL
jgi:hypothetical protein